MNTSIREPQFGGALSNAKPTHMQANGETIQLLIYVIDEVQNKKKKLRKKSSRLTCVKFQNNVQTFILLLVWFQSCFCLIFTISIENYFWNALVQRYVKKYNKKRTKC